MPACPRLQQQTVLPGHQRRTGRADMQGPSIQAGAYHGWRSQRRQVRHLVPALHHANPLLAPAAMQRLNGLIFCREAAYGGALAPFLSDPRNLFVISSDFCHWGHRFGFTYHDMHIHVSWTYLERSFDLGTSPLQQKGSSGQYSGFHVPHNHPD